MEEEIKVARNKKNRMTEQAVKRNGKGRTNQLFDFLMFKTAMVVIRRFGGYRYVCGV